MKNGKKKPYAKPQVVYRDKVEVLAAVCNSAWNGTSPCRLLGSPGCVKTRL